MLNLFVLFQNRFPSFDDDKLTDFHNKVKDIVKITNWIRIPGKGKRTPKNFNKQKTKEPKPKSVKRFWPLLVF